MGGCLAAVMSKHELVEVNVELVAAHAVGGHGSHCCSCLWRGLPGGTTDLALYPNSSGETGMRNVFGSRLGGGLQRRRRTPPGRGGYLAKKYYRRIEPLNPLHLVWGVQYTLVYLFPEAPDSLRDAIDSEEPR